MRCIFVSVVTTVLALGPLSLGAVEGREDPSQVLTLDNEEGEQSPSPGDEEPECE